LLDSLLQERNEPIVCGDLRVIEKIAHHESGRGSQVDFFASFQGGSNGI